MKNMRWTRKRSHENKGTPQTKLTDTAHMKKRIRLKYQKRAVRRLLEHCEKQPVTKDDWNGVATAQTVIMKIVKEL
ncbi:hypothetical protein A2U01_0085009 [Trifolium medium]|uniref:Uncharacterized protein n=1 Tax=Trifolium medium TaxID=97028 RepID=A0A392TRU5_9FABA|nr:hypothetical protein [Trifolium medium]